MLGAALVGITRVAALDIGKAELVCCVRVPDPKGSTRRVRKVQTYSTMTRSLQVMAERLMHLGVTRVVMEATSDYWKPPFYWLEAHGFEVWLVTSYFSLESPPRCCQVPMVALAWYWHRPGGGRRGQSAALAGHRGAFLSGSTAAGDRWCRVGEPTDDVACNCWRAMEPSWAGPDRQRR
ncbi:IS110 family transposase [Flexivirga caeni]|uniref:IS110 family transposase n=1 Tax=Flexivirga caeni TaxID=2294115 RepID=UPI001FE31E31|nr:IS110 family transposase [Flexivirga caeni]